ncbi:MAG: NAD(P)H-hydrate dehydratase [Bacteroidales bacterium]|nr:NAD(P)H-hydrate dehydratase [Bacteroidales bacterium]
MNIHYGSKIFLTEQIKELDRRTLLAQNISEAALIARAARAFFDAIYKMYPPPREVVIFCGPGNNGKDGHALAPLLQEAGYKVELFDLMIDESKPLPTVSDSTLLIDALFGAGLNRPPQGAAAAWVAWMNKASGIRIALDIPSGWHGEENVVIDHATIVQAHHCLTLDFPKLSFFFPESAPYVGAWQVVPLGLAPEAIDAVETPYRMVSTNIISSLLMPLPKFLHKGTAGRVRLLAGSAGMMGAAALAAKAAYRSGAGWVEPVVPASEVQLMQMMVPEAIVRNADDSVATNYNSAVFGAGPGLGVSEAAAERLRAFLEVQTRPCVLDADALNILATRPEWWTHVPQNSIITPHAGEFKRLAGGWENDYERLQLQRRFAAQHQTIVVLKGAFSSIAFPDGTVYFNVSGNPGMATAGSGDVLTGILSGLLAQGFPPQESALLGVYLHGLAGDLAAETLGERSLMASDIVKKICSAMQHFR